MDDFLPIKEDLAAIRTDRISFGQYNCVHSYPVHNVHSFKRVIDKLHYERILLGVELRKNNYIEEEVDIKYESKETHALNKSRKYLEMIFHKDEFLQEYDLINNIYLSAEVNDFIFMILNPKKGKKYFDVLSGKVSIDIEGEHERILWFEHDASDIYVAN
ncbi:hypothetical protein VKA52_16960 [Halobacillus sp. HZG1]|uniref:hypothetical protein n=1 Tax=Halobacillus sp. HZG1 TaxID=3111769 RepID=UPI002DBB0F7E|nr:hypothetical protein [Halobacillus sp. HZG1]MEC3885430.1 hypothetical protein [Halobacillus sp. HZG1]